LAGKGNSPFLRASGMRGIRAADFLVRKTEIPALVAFSATSKFLLRLDLDHPHFKDFFSALLTIEAWCPSNVLNSRCKAFQSVRF
jgi:hypothetical protein